MHAASLTLIAVAGLSAVALVGQSEPAAAASRSSIMAKCNNLARRQNPSYGRDVSRNRTFTYRACMQRAGQRP